MKSNSLGTMPSLDSSMCTSTCKVQTTKSTGKWWNVDQRKKLLSHDNIWHLMQKEQSNLYSVLGRITRNQTSSIRTYLEEFTSLSLSFFLTLFIFLLLHPIHSPPPPPPPPSTPTPHPPCLRPLPPPQQLPKQTLLFCRKLPISPPLPLPNPLPRNQKKKKTQLKCPSVTAGRGKVKRLTLVNLTTSWRNRRV